MYSDDLFNDKALEEKSSFQEKNTERSQDGLYRIDLSKVTLENKKRGYRSVLRFLPNITDDQKYIRAYAGDRYNEDLKTALGPSYLEKVSHYLDIKEESMSNVKGWYDDPTNINLVTGQKFKDKSPLAQTYFALRDSKNAVEQAKAAMIKYQKKYFSYVLVIEDEQQPELVGKILIYSYGKQIKDIIESEKNGEVTGQGCNVFDLAHGKDFVLLAKEKSININGKDIVVPDYTKSSFKESTTSVSLPINKDGGIVLKNVPLNDDGKFEAKYQDSIRKFLLTRETPLEVYAPKAWTEEQETKINEALAYLTGKNSSYNSSDSSNEPDVDEFSFDTASEEGGLDDDFSTSSDDNDLDFGDDDSGDFDDLPF